MRIARDVAEAAGFGPSALTIGNFDGVHIGHQHLFRKTARFREAMGAQSGGADLRSASVACRRAGAHAAAADHRRERCALMAAQGIEQVLVLPFTLEVARLTPEEFVRDILVNALRARIVMVGENFRFGHKQAGDTRCWRARRALWFRDVCIADAGECRGHVVSSSEVRKLIESGEAGMAWRFLGRPYSIAGEVVHGRGVGSKQTVPTLNLNTSAEVLPRNGVYVTRTLRSGGVRKRDDGTRSQYRISSDV